MSLIGKVWGMIMIKNLLNKAEKSLDIILIVLMILNILEVILVNWIMVGLCYLLIMFIISYLEVKVEKRGK